MGRFLSGRPLSNQPGKPRETKHLPRMSGNARILAQRAREIEEERDYYVKRRTTRAKERRKQKVLILHDEFLRIKRGETFFVKHVEVVALSLMVSLWEKDEKPADERV